MNTAPGFDNRTADQAKPGADVAAVVINFNTATHTLVCLRSLADLDLGLQRVLLIDNASEDEDLARLQAGLAGIDLPLELQRNSQNLGFAGASDLAVRKLLEDPTVARLLLLNNDAVALPALRNWLAQARGDLCAARVMQLDDPQRIDSLGIVMYRSGLASNRLDTDEPLLGPTGGCAVYSRRVLEALLEAHGHAFDPGFFCYAEDTDLALRALLLGFETTYFDQAVALHGGQASSGGGFNDFVLYHGIRNSIWVLVKGMPWQLLLRCAPWIAAMHLAIPLRHGRMGKWRVVWRLYLDAWLGLGACIKQRKRIQATRHATPSGMADRMSRKFYDRGYVRDALRQLVGG